MERSLELRSLDDARASSRKLYELCKRQRDQALHYGHRTWVLAHWKSSDICYDWGFMFEGTMLRIWIYNDLKVRINLTPTKLVAFVELKHQERPVYRRCIRAF